LGSAEGLGGGEGLRGGERLRGWGVGRGDFVEEAFDGEENKSRLEGFSARRMQEPDVPSRVGG